MNTWDKKDINIQVAQSVNLAIQVLGDGMLEPENTKNMKGSVKTWAKMFYQILSELKEEIMAKELAREQKLQEEEDGMANEDIADMVGE